LYEYITPDYAVYWKLVGTLLGISSGELKIIEYDCNDKAVPCCNTMLEKWLEVDPTATWEKLFVTIDSQAVLSAIASGTNIASIQTVIVLCMYTKIYYRFSCCIKFS